MNNDDITKSWGELIKDVRRGKIDIVARLRSETGHSRENFCEDIQDLTNADADRIEADGKRIAELEAVIAWANNSLYGSHGFFLSLQGDLPDNEHHLDSGIEKLKADNRKQYSEIESLRAKVERIKTAVYEMHNDHIKGDFELPDLARIDLNACLDAITEDGNND